MVPSILLTGGTLYNYALNFKKLYISPRLCRTDTTQKVSVLGGAKNGINIQKMSNFEKSGHMG